MSSPSQISATKKSSLWLHWNYTYTGDYPGMVIYREQIIGYTSKVKPKLVPLAKRNGPSSALVKQSSIIAGPFNGRIDVIGDNSTLVVNNLRFNDSGTNFSSYVDIGFGTPPTQNIVDLRPVVTIEVIGEFSVL